ncbi:MAG: hypothetical protein A2Y33_07570 [Spirochaetes bacterium GWF1_51_8]|nr:MAG: hypothetical protein A2Y33_07570 [Spirochaetes bacterium GWF1_51_8]
MSKDFNAEGLEKIKESFRRMSEKCPSTSQSKEFFYQFLNIISAYEGDNTKINYPELLNSYREIVIELRNSLSPEDVGEVAEIIKTECRMCMFHSDDCFMNVFYIVFKSIEKDAFVEPNRLRPTLRRA